MKADRAAPPTVYLLYGDDSVALKEAVERLRAKVGDESAVAMNVDRLQGEGLDLERLRSICASMPFLARRRMVILEDPLRLLGKASLRQPFLELLADLPPSTALVLVQQVDLEATRGKLPKPLAQFVEWLAAHLPGYYAQRLQLPHGQGFARWLQKRARQEGGEMEGEAAALLAEMVGEDPLIAQQELGKLLDYVNRARPVTAADVERLTPFHGQSDVFAMVDALGQRDAKTALHHLEGLLQSQSAQYAFAMIVRQVRLMLMARETIDLRRPLESALHVHPYVAQKVAAQARNFSLRDLERLMLHLLEVDQKVKTGQADLQLALERLIAGLAA